MNIKKCLLEGGHKLAMDIGGKHTCTCDQGMILIPYGMHKDIIPPATGGLPCQVIWHSLCKVGLSFSKLSTCYYNL